MATINGTSGNNKLIGLNGADTLNGLAGNDILYGLGGIDKLYGGDGIDKLYGGTGNDVLDGGRGNDTLDGGGGVDIMRGGVGNDIYVVDSLSDVVSEKAGQGTDLVKSSVTWALSSNFENLTLTGINSIGGTGNGRNNTITGNNFANKLDGGLGINALNGAKGDDMMMGANGTNHYNGGDGFDTVNYSGAVPTVLTALTEYGVIHGSTFAQLGIAVEVGGGDNFTGIAPFTLEGAVGGTAGAALGDTLTSVEKVVGTDYSDIINFHVSGVAAGGGGADELILFAGGAAYGGDGGDGLMLQAGGNGYGEAGNDVLRAASGGLLNGGSDNDQLYNDGSSRTTFLFDDNTGKHFSGTDDVYGFKKVAGAANGDVLRLLETDAKGSWAKPVVVGSDTVFYFKEGTVVQATVTVHGVTGLVAGDDFILI
jgi:RTX calcium-binding nonapeptide repeat (4 copies)